MHSCWESFFHEIPFSLVSALFIALEIGASGAFFEDFLLRPYL